MASNFPLGNGRWIGRGSYLTKGASLTTQIDLSFEVVSESVGTHVKGSQSLRDGSSRHAFACWITANDTGTYDLAAQFAAANLTGNAKLESLPSLGLLWSKDGITHATFTLFEVRGGWGCRGFYHASDALLSWEVMLEPHNRVAAKDSANVIAIDPRKRRR